MLWGGRRDFLPRSQEVKRRDGNPNAIVCPLCKGTMDPAVDGAPGVIGLLKKECHVMVLGAVKGRARARAASGFIP